MREELKRGEHKKRETDTDKKRKRKGKPLRRDEYNSDPISFKIVCRRGY